MITEKLQELQDAREAVAKLEEAAAAQMLDELAALPEKYGYKSAADFLKAVALATMGETAKRGKKGTKRGKRAKITDATRAAVKDHVQSGKTGREIAKLLRISLPSVQNIKKSLGLVQKRGK